MARLAGVDLPNMKRSVIALTYIRGIGLTSSKKILEEAGVDASKRAKDLTKEEIAQLAGILERKFVVEGGLQRQVNSAIQRLKDIGCYRGMRHRKSLPVRGQRTRSNARTRKGPAKTVAKKKKATK